MMSKGAGPHNQHMQISEKQAHITSETCGYRPEAEHCNLNNESSRQCALAFCKCPMQIPKLVAAKMPLLSLLKTVSDEMYYKPWCPGEVMTRPDQSSAISDCIVATL